MKARLGAALALALTATTALPGSLLASPPAASASAAEPPPDLRAVMRAAAVLDPGTFTHKIKLSVRASPEGVSRLRLTPEVLSLARADLGDVRVIDGESRQWPYVIKAGAVQQLVDVTFAPPVLAQGTSRYAVQLAAWPAQIDELLIRVDREYLDRPYRLVGKPAGESGAERAIATGRIVRRVGEAAQAAIPVPPVRLGELALVIDDGDDAPLTLTKARAAFTVPDLLLVAPSGEYALLVGDPTAAPPKYDLARAREAILGATAGVIETGPLGLSPTHRVPVAEGQEGGPEQLALWAALGLAVVVLAGLALRLARHEKGKPPSQEM
ncbi:MAG: hypothetical protein ABJE95_09765 [Byssovorax sp.]